MSRILSKLITAWVQLRGLFLYVFPHAIVVNGYVDDHTWRGIRHRNWGDDLNYYLLRELTGRPIIFFHNFKMAKWMCTRNYLCIGTLLDGEKYKNKNTIVWGSGCSGAARGLSYPKRVLAVRGPKSREYLISQGIGCPEIYGDPALLLPLVYQPQTKKEYQLGIIPHVVDQHHPVIQEIREKYSNSILVIDLAHYEQWTDVIDQICSCEKIFSSSLHGLIVSDAYQVPNCWIELTGNISGGYFKFYDYASSVGRNWSIPLRIETANDVTSQSNETFTVADVEKLKEIQRGLLGTAPFKTKLD